jgi:hypothetical protein
MTEHLRPLREFYSDVSKHTFNRVARVCATEGSDYVVEMYEDNKLVESRTISGHTLEYAEDCAENWVTGVI